MNEKIKQLANQARVLADQFQEQWKAGPSDEEFFQEKFAELIVKECGNWFNSRLVVEPDYSMEHRIERNRAVVGVMKEFNQHFGVEE